MKFKKQTNGNILVTDDSDKNIFFIQDVPTVLTVKGNNEYIEIRQNGLIVYDFLATDVIAYQILPAAEVAFADTASDFVDILSEFFFLNSEVVVIPGTVDVNIVSPNPLPVSGSFAFAYPPGALDAFARQRMSSPVTIFDSKHTSDNRPLLYDDQQTSGSGTTSTHNVNTSSVTLAVSNLTAGKRVRQTFRRFNYQPGKSQLVILTGVLGTPLSGISRKYGLFDDNNGLFFDSTNTNVGVNVRTFTTGAAVTTRIAQSSWNIDKLDGTGASGVTLDFSKTQIFFFDFEWLGVGTVRFGFFIDGMPIYCHAVNNANVLTDVYMTTPNLPIRISIENDGTGVAANVKQICCTVISEGGFDGTGYPIAIDRGTSPLQTNNNTNLYPLFAIRLKSGYLGSSVSLRDFSIICTTNSAYNFVWLLNPTVTGTAFSYTSLPNASIEYDASTTNATTVSGGTVLSSGVGFQSNQGGDTKGTFTREFNLGANIAGTAQVVVLAVRRLTGGAETFYASVNLNDQK